MITVRRRRQLARTAGSRRRRSDSPASPSRASPTATRHAFHRALRGRTPDASGDRSGPGASRCTPSPRSSTRTRYFELARDTYAEMRATGITAVGEFHYLHHQPDGTPYDDPNAMGRRCSRRPTRPASGSACSTPATSRPGIGRRAGGRAGAVLRRRRRRVGGAGRLRSTTRRVGAAIHSVRAVPRDQLRWSSRPPRDAAARPPLRAGRRERSLPRRRTASPRPQLLAEAGALGPRPPPCTPPT